MSDLAHSLTAHVAAGKVEKPNQIPELDGLRGVAALMIVIFHYVVEPINLHPIDLPGHLERYFMVFESGVDVFFVLSGFLLGGILFDQRNSSNCLQVFYIRRFVRILPPYVLLLGCYAITIAWYDATLRSGMPWLMADPLPFWSYVLYIQNFFMAATSSWGAMFLAATWSLSVEEQFYLILPLLIILTPPRFIPYVLTGLIAVAVTLRLALFLVGPQMAMANFVLLPTRWDSLFLGVAAAWVVRNTNMMGVFAKRPAILPRLFWISLVLCGLLPLLGEGRNSWAAVYGYTWLGITVAIFIVYVRVQSGGFLGAGLRMKWLRSFGRISYTVYLFHLPFLGLLFSIAQQKAPTLSSGADCLTAAGAFVLTVLLAKITWCAFEAPFIKLGHSLAYNGAGKRKLMTAAVRG